MPNLITVPQSSDLPSTAKREILTAMIEKTQSLLDEGGTDNLKQAIRQSNAIGFLLKEFQAEYELVCEAQKLRILTGRKIGEYLSNVERKPGNREGETPLQQTITELGITEARAIRCQRIAQVEEEQLEEYFDQCIGQEEEITLNGVLNLLAPCSQVDHLPPQAVPDGITARPKGGTGRASIDGLQKRIFFPNVGDFTPEQQFEQLMEAANLAHWESTGEEFDAEVFERDTLPGYWVSRCCQDYLAEAHARKADQGTMSQAEFLTHRAAWLDARIAMDMEERARVEQELEKVMKG